MPSGIYFRTKETLAKITSQLGRKRSEETKEKMRISFKGRNKGSKSPKWKGQEVGYRGMHYWVRRWKGIPQKCEKCGATNLEKKRISWANIDHKYRRVLDDYIALCPKCHGEYDTEHNLRLRN